MTYCLLLTDRPFEWIEHDDMTKKYYDTLDEAVVALHGFYAEDPTYVDQIYHIESNQVVYVMGDSL